MVKWIYKSAIILSLFVLSIVVWLVIWGGLIGYLKVLLSIHKLPPPLRSKAISSLNSNEQGAQGILARVDSSGRTGIWIWRQFKLQYFPSDTNTVYSYWHVCDARGSAQLSDGESVPIERYVDTDITLWANKAKPGQFVTLQLSDDAHTKRIKEIQEYDWQVYMPPGFESQCEK